MELLATFPTWQEGCAVVVILPKHRFHFKPLCEVYLVPVVRWLLFLWWAGGSTFCPDTFPCLWHEWVSQGSFWASINKQINMFHSRSHFTQTCLECSSFAHSSSPYCAALHWEPLEMLNIFRTMEQGFWFLDARVSGSKSNCGTTELVNFPVLLFHTPIQNHAHTFTHHSSRLLFVGQKIGLTRGCVCTAMGSFLFLVSASYIESALSLRLGAQALWS